MHHSKPVKAWVRNSGQDRTVLPPQLQPGTESGGAIERRSETGHRFKSPGPHQAQTESRRDIAYGEAGAIARASHKVFPRPKGELCRLILFAGRINNSQGKICFIQKCNHPNTNGACFNDSHFTPAFPKLICARQSLASPSMSITTPLPKVGCSTD